MKKLSAVPNLSKSLLTASLKGQESKSSAPRKEIPEQTFSRYLDAWKFKEQTGCKRKIKKTGYSEYTV